MVPYDTRRRIEEVQRACDDDGHCPYCLMLESELEAQQRLICHNEAFVAFIPYAAFSPFHTWVIPRRHGPTFLDQTAPERLALAHILREIFGKLYYGLHDPDYNYIIRSAPNRDASSAYLHWYLSIVPRVTRSAGFELGTGMYINPSLPEESAQFLREQSPDPPET
jgi:UDPglucose--hexose-1-phosphate uridylyltransferase